jgi:hypothetical protein
MIRIELRKNCILIRIIRIRRRISCEASHTIRQTTIKVRIKYFT